MKRYIALLLFGGLLSRYTLMNAQSLNDGMYDAKWQRDRDAMNVPLHNDNDEFYNYVKSAPSPVLYQKVSDAVNQAKGGIRIETSSYSPTSSSSKRTTNQQAQQIKKTKNDANHRTFFEQKRRKEAYAREQYHLEQKRKKKEEEYRQRIKYNTVYNSKIQATAANAARTQAKIDYRATEGRDFMYNYQPEGTEKLSSNYIPSTDKPTDGIVAIVPKSGVHPVSLSQPISSLRIEYTDYELLREKELIRSIKSTELRKPIFTCSAEEKQWKGLLGKLYTSHASALNEILAQEAHTDQFITINPKGEYVFGNEEDTKWSFVSPDGSTITVYTVEQHFWEDDNIIKKIKNDGFMDSFWNSCEFNPTLTGIKGERVKFNELKDMTPEEITRFLPQIKAELKTTIFDNSATLAYEQYWFSTQNPASSLASLLTDSYVNSTAVLGGKGSLSGGGKAEIKGHLSAGIQTVSIEKKGENENTKTTSKVTGPGISGGGSIKFSLLDVSGKVTVGSIVSIGDQSYMFKIKGDGEAGVGVKAGISAKITDKGWGYKVTNPLVHNLPIYREGGVQFEVKNITSK